MTDVHARTRALLERVAGAVDAHGRLPLPDLASWDIFPFEGDLLVKRLEGTALPVGRCSSLDLPGPGRRGLIRRTR